MQPSKYDLNKAFEESEEKNLSFILFSLGGELYGTPLLSTREVIKQGEIKPTPYMVPHFKGVINLRGQIISVIDLRLKFAIAAQIEKGLILIIEHATGVLGAIVDDLVSVERIAKEQVDQNTTIETKIPLDYMLGVAKVKDRLVNLVDMSGCLFSEDLKTITKNAA